MEVEGNNDMNILLQDMNEEGSSTGASLPADEEIQIKEASTRLYETNWHTFLRALNLQILYNISSIHSFEKPKAAIRSNKKVVLIRSLIHLFPILGAIVLIAINCQTVFYKGDTFWASALQFVAKAHEMMMISSITTIALAYLRHQFVMLGDAPFGALFPILQVSQLSSLWSVEFWATATSSSFGSHRKAVFIIFMSFCILLAASVGPSSAIAMVPRVTTFRAATATQTIESWSESDIYPNRLSGDNLCQDCSVFPGCNIWTICAQCTNISYVDSPGSTCPAQDWQIMNEYLPSSSQFVQIPGTDWTRNIVLNTSPDGTPMPTNATTQSALVAEIFSAFSNRWWDPSVTTFAGTEDIPGATSATFVSMTEQRNFSSTMQLTAIAKQPYVYSDCRPFAALVNDTNLVQFGTTGKGVIQDSRLSVADVAKSSSSNPHGHIIWLEPSVIDSSNVSMLATIVMAQNYNDQINAPGNVTLAAACTVKAAWIPSTFSSTSEKLNPNGIIAVANADDAIWGDPQSPLVAITTSWANLAIPQDGLLANDQQSAIDSTNNLTIVDALLRNKKGLVFTCWADSAFNLSETDNCEFAQEILSGLIALGMAQLHIAEVSNDGGGGLGFLTNTGPSSDQTYNITATLWISGPMYSLEGFPIKLSIAILSLYCIFAILAVVYFIVDGTSSTSWDSISGLTSLALNSERPTVLQNTSAGITETETFRHRVSIRAKQDQGLQLVFENDEGKYGPYQRVQKNACY